jgi:hypothetical protein
MKKNKIHPSKVALTGAIMSTLGLTHHVEGPRNGKRYDANETAFLTRQIEHVRSKVYEVQVASLLARSFLPTATDIPSWAQFVVEVIFDSAGQAKVVTNGSDDAPRVDLIASEQSYKVVSLADSYGFTLMDMRQALGVGMPLSDKKGKTAHRVLDTATDEILATGTLASANQTLGLVGFINASAVPIVTATAGSWAAATADAIIADVTKLIQAPSQATLQIFDSDTVIMAPAKYDFIAAKPRSATSDTTILEFLQRTNPGVSFQKWHRLTSAGAGSLDRLVAYKKSDEVIEAIVPQEFEQLPPQVKNLETVTICHSRCGGVRIHHPKALAYLDATA